MADVAELSEKFAIPGVLGFEKTASGLVFARVTSPAAEATIYLQGAHVTHWKPAGGAAAIFLSQRAEFAPGKPIRGGVPVIFPWFGERHDGGSGPMHGFARVSEWELAFAALVGDEVHLAFTLAPNELSHSLGFDHFKLSYRVSIGHTLTLELTVLNDSGSGGARAASAETNVLGAALVFEEALHAYYAVADARRVLIDGLGGTTYIDKVDELKRKVQPAGALRFVGRTDRPYLKYGGDLRAARLCGRAADRGRERGFAFDRGLEPVERTQREDAGHGTRRVAAYDLRRDRERGRGCGDAGAGSDALDAREYLD
jgi:glucose-6-phosphate 1-epimerase